MSPTLSRRSSPCGTARGLSLFGRETIGCSSDARVMTGCGSCGKGTNGCGVSPDPLGRIKDILSPSTRQVLIVAVASWLLLLMPNSLLAIMGLAGLRGQWRAWIGLVALLSVAWLLALPLYQAGEYAHKRFMKWQARRGRGKWLADLTPVEKGYLQEYIQHDTTTRTFSYSDGVARGLEAKGILYRASTLSREVDLFDYNIQPWAYRALKANPGLLAGAAPPRDGRGDWD